MAEIYKTRQRLPSLDPPNEPNQMHFAHLRLLHHARRTILQVDQATSVDTQEEDFLESIQQSQACPPPDEQINCLLYTSPSPRDS